MGFLDRFKKKEVLSPISLGGFKVDMHSHLIPGIDDGSQSMDETIAATRLRLSAPAANWIDHMPKAPAISINPIVRVHSRPVTIPISSTGTRASRKTIVCQTAIVAIPKRITSRTA